MSNPLAISVAKMMALFAGNASAHGTHGEPDARTEGGKCPIKQTARTLRTPVTPFLWEQHLRGEQPLGIIPIREDNTCHWGSIDFDEYDVNLLDIIARAEAALLPLVPCRSKSGGLHLFLFLSEPAAAGDVQKKLVDAASLLGLEACEIFPKQTELNGDAVGNWMVMPYYGDTYNGKLKQQVGLKKTGSEMDLEEFLRTAESWRTTLDKVVVRKVHRPQRVEQPSSQNFTDGPPCLQTLADGLPLIDGRKRVLFMMAIYFKRRNPIDWRSHLEGANNRYFSSPLSAAEVVSLQTSVSKKEYRYTCSEEPMCSSCNSALCQKRDFGVGDGVGTGRPVIVSWKKIVSEEPVWLISLEGSDAQLTITRIDDLTNYRRFTDQCAQQLNRFFLPMKQADWINVLRQAESELKLEEATVGTTRKDRFHEMLEEFVTNRARAISKEDILAGRPWENEEDGRHYFRLKDLDKHLKRESVRDMSRSECCAWIRAFGGGERPTSIKGKTYRLWFVPCSAVDKPQVLDLPRSRGEPI
jgi:hypothetical protein